LDFKKFYPKKEIIKSVSIYGFDIETYGNKNIFLMGSIVNSENPEDIYVFWDKELMKKFILSEKFIGCYMVASNLQFDFLGLFGDDIDLLSKFRVIFRGSELINATFQYHNKNTTGKIRFIDTFNFIKCSVDSLGRIIGISKLEKPKCLGNKIEENSKEGKELEIYNIRDSYISGKFVNFLQNTFNDLGVNLKITSPACAMALFRSRYMNSYLLQPDRETLSIFYKGYYGGRCETFIRGEIKDKLFYYDVNGLYPYCMAKYNYPFPNSIITETLYNQDTDIIFKYEGISYCDVSINKDIIPFLPYRNENKLLFPLGNFKGWYSHAELRKAYSLGYEIKLLETISYEETYKPFADYVNDLYKLRLKYQEEKNPNEVCIKLMSNSLYGKYGQRMTKQDLLFINNPEDYAKYKECIENCRKGNIRYKLLIPDPDLPYVYIEDTETEIYPKFINPIFSIYVTSYARITLYEYFEKVLSKGGSIYYCDTDSIITDVSLNEFVGKELGQIKLELETDYSIFVKPKFYYMQDKQAHKDKVKAKGMSNLKTYLEFQKILNTGIYQYTKFTKFKESVKRKFAFNEKIEVLKMINMEDSKRLWDKPFNLKEKQRSKAIII